MHADAGTGTRWLLRIGTAITLAFLYAPLVVLAIYAFSKRGSRPGRRAASRRSGSARRSTTRASATRCGRACRPARGDADRAAARDARRLRRRALRLLRPQHDLVPRRAADRAAGNRHRHGAERDLHAGTRGRPRAVDDRRRRTRRSASSSSSTTPSRDCAGRRRRSRRRPATWARRACAAFRDITFPQMRSALIAGALLAFALSFDEIIVTTFTSGDQETLPIWIFSNLSRPREPAGRQRGRRDRRRALAHPGVHRPAAVGRSGDRGRDRARRADGSGRVAGAPFLTNTSRFP